MNVIIAFLAAGCLNDVKNYAPINPFTPVGTHRALLDFTLSNARRFYSSMREPLKSEKVNDVKNLNFPIKQR